MPWIFVEFQRDPGKEAAEAALNYIYVGRGILRGPALVPPGIDLVDLRGLSHTNPRSVDMQVVNGGAPDQDVCESVRTYVQQHFGRDKCMIKVGTFEPG